MRKAIVCAATPLAFVADGGAAEAKGCIKGALVGGGRWQATAKSGPLLDVLLDTTEQRSGRRTRNRAKPD